MIEKLFRPLYRVFVRIGVIKLFVNKITKRIALTSAYYMYKTGLIPYSPTEQKIKYKTKVQIKKVVEKPSFVAPNKPNPLVPAGKLIPETNSGLPPVIIFDVRDESDPKNCIDRIAHLQLVTFGFKPVFLTDNPDFSYYREYGYLFEYLPNKDLFSSTDTPLSYADFINQRIVELVALYQPRRFMKAGEIKPYLKNYTNPAVTFI